MHKSNTSVLAQQMKVDQLVSADALISFLKELPAKYNKRTASHFWDSALQVLAESAVAVSEVPQPLPASFARSMAAVIDGGAADVHYC